MTATFTYTPFVPDQIPPYGAVMGLLSNELASANSAVISGTKITLVNSSAIKTIMVGTGFTVSTDGNSIDIIGGTITSLTVKLESRTVVSGTGLHISAKAYFDAVEAGNETGLLALIYKGNDSQTGTSIIDQLYGFSGNDTLKGMGGNDLLLAGNGADLVIGGTGNDLIGGQGGNDKLFGNNNKDMLYGGAGADTINGGSGNDLLSGQGGNDVLTGGSGADQFLFETAPTATNRDLIRDFIAGTDKFQLDNDGFSALLVPGALAASAFFKGTSAHDGTDRILYDQATGWVFYDPDGIGGVGATKFAKVTVGLNLTAADFVVID